MRLALALTLTLIPTAAHALYVPPTTMTVVRPQQGEQAVPLNTKLWLDAETATELRDPPRGPPVHRSRRAGPAERAHDDRHPRRRHDRPEPAHPR